MKVWRKRIKGKSILAKINPCPLGVQTREIAANDLSLYE